MRRQFKSLDEIYDYLLDLQHADGPFTRALKKELRHVDWPVRNLSLTDTSQKRRACFIFFHANSGFQDAASHDRACGRAFSETLTQTFWDGIRKALTIAIAYDQGNDSGVDVETYRNNLVRIAIFLRTNAWNYPLFFKNRYSDSRERRLVNNTLRELEVSVLPQFEKLATQRLVELGALDPDVYEETADIIEYEQIDRLVTAPIIRPIDSKNLETWMDGAFPVI